MDIKDYRSCWYCDNIVDHPEQIGLLHLDFPRCFILVRNITSFLLSSAEDFNNENCQINWLDPSELSTASDREEVLYRLWDFFETQDAEEERLSFDRRIDEFLESE